MTINNANISYDASISVIYRIKNKCTSRCIGIALWRRDLRNDLVQWKHGIAARLANIELALEKINSTK